MFYTGVNPGTIRIRHLPAHDRPALIFVLRRRPPCRLDSYTASPAGVRSLVYLEEGVLEQQVVQHVLVEEPTRRS